MKKSDETRESYRPSSLFTSTFAANQIDLSKNNFNLQNMFKKKSENIESHISGKDIDHSRKINNWIAKEKNSRAEMPQFLSQNFRPNLKKAFNRTDFKPNLDMAQNIQQLNKLKKIDAQNSHDHSLIKNQKEEKKLGVKKAKFQGQVAFGAKSKDQNGKKDYQNQIEDNILLKESQEIDSQQLRKKILRNPKTLNPSELYYKFEDGFETQKEEKITSQNKIIDEDKNQNTEKIIEEDLTTEKISSSNPNNKNIQLENKDSLKYIIKNPNNVFYLPADLILDTYAEREKKILPEFKNSDKKQKFLMKILKKYKMRAKRRRSGKIELEILGLKLELLKLDLYGQKSFKCLFAGKNRFKIQQPVKQIYTASLILD